MQLYRTPSKNNKYVNYYLVWKYNNKTYKVPVKASFKKDFPKLYAQALSDISEL